MVVETLDVVAAAVSVVFFGGIGVLLLARGGRGLEVRAFAAWLLGWALWDGISYGVPSGLAPDAVLLVLGVLLFVIAAATAVLVAAMARHFVGAVGPRAGGLWPWAGLAVASYVVGVVSFPLRGVALTPPQWVYAAGAAAALGFSMSGLLWYPTLVRGADRPQVRRLLLVGVAVASWPLFAAGSAVDTFARNRGGDVWVFAPLLALPLLAAVRWSLLPRGLRGLRWTAIPWLLALVAAGQISAAFFTDEGDLANMAYIVVTTGLILYALFHEKVLRVDLGMRWTISRGLLPGLALIVFFVASEAAQQFFGDRAGNAYLGIAAAAVLLVAVRPVQRVAERLADRAVPGVPTVRPFAAPAEVFRHAVRAAMLDGRLTAPEERELALLQDRLGLAAAAALDVRREVKRELRVR